MGAPPTWGRTRELPAASGQARRRSSAASACSSASSSVAKARMVRTPTPPSVPRGTASRANHPRRVPRGTASRANHPRRVPRGTASRGDDLDERAPAVEVDLPVGLLGQARRRWSARRPVHRDGPASPPGPATWRAPASPAKSPRRTRAASPWRRPRRARHGLTTRSPRPSSRIAVRRNAAFLAIGSTSVMARPGRSSASGIAGRPPPLPTSITRAGCSSLRASANASGKCSPTSTSIERAAVRLMRAFQRSSDSP